MKRKNVNFDNDLRTSNRREKEIVDGIFNGSIKEYDLENHMTPYEMVAYDASITKAFKRVNEIKAKIKERPMYVMFISGESGIGKDVFAVEWCKKKNLAYYRMSNNPDNPFSGYLGQPVIIWSDARDYEFEPNKLYQLIDNHYNSMQKSKCSDRYISVKYLLITTIIPLEDWYSDFYSKKKEDKGQLYRHISEKAIMDENSISLYAYNKDTNTYNYFCKFPNTYRHEEAVLDTYDKQLAHTMKLLGAYKDEFTPVTEGTEPDTNS